jgi:hypothetical protein
VSRTRWRLVAAAAFLASAAVAPIAAQGADSAPPAQPVTFSRQAFFTAPATAALPQVLVHEFPPGVVCIVVPQACPEGLQQIKTALGINPGIPIPASPDYQAPQPVLPGTLPVGMLGGKPRYSSFVKFDMPKIGSDQKIDRFDLVLGQDQLTFAFESPAFRAAVLAALSTYEAKSPDPITAFLMSLADQSTPIATPNPTGIEACLVAQPWQDGASQDMAKAPKTDCLYGTTGRFDSAANTWTFDLSSVAQAWLDGAYPNEGIYIGPIGAPNVAYGDPDVSTNFLISLTSSGSATGVKPALRVATSPKPSDEVAAAPSPDLSSAGGAGEVQGATLTAPSSDLSSLSPGPVASAASGGGTKLSTTTRAARLAAHHHKSIWYVWFWVPVVLLGMLALLQGFETTTPATAGREEGALTRLVATRRRPPGAPPTA